MNTLNCRLLLNFRGWHLWGKHWYTLDLPKTGSGPLYAESSQFVTKCPESSKIKLTSVTGQGNSILIQGKGRHIIIFHFLCLLKADSNLLHGSFYSSRIGTSKDCSSLLRHIAASCFPASFICFRNNPWHERKCCRPLCRQSKAKQREVFFASLLIQKQSSQVKTQFLHFLHHKEKGKVFLLF